MKEVTTIGLDLAKNVFQVHGVDASGKTVVRRQLRRGQVLGFFRKLPPCLVGLEACASAHYWAREITVLGHEVRMMPARYVKPYVKLNKNDAADAEAICEAVTRPSMRFVAIKTLEQQVVLMLHRTRQLLVRQRIMLVNALRAHLAELGIVAGLGRTGLARWLGPMGIAPFPLPAHRTGRAVFPHPALRLASPLGTRRGPRCTLMRCVTPNSPNTSSAGKRRVPRLCTL